MKIRQGFVSNSSSASFVIIKQGLTDEQIHAIKNHIDVALDKANSLKLERDTYGSYDYYGYLDEHDAWNVSETKRLFFLETTMANFDVCDFLKKELNIPEEKFDLHDDGYFISYEMPEHVLEYDEKLKILEREVKLKRIVK